jgi:hypothetical protein
VGSSEEPRNLVEHAADAGIQAIAAHLAHADAKIKTLLIVLDAEDVPEGEVDCVSAGSGIEDPRDLIAMLAGHLAGAGRQVGLTVQIIPVEKIGEG